MYKYYLLLIILLSTGWVQSQVPAGFEVIRPGETDSVLTNPGIGFNTSKHSEKDMTIIPALMR